MLSPTNAIERLRNVITRSAQKAALPDHNPVKRREKERFKSHAFVSLCCSLATHSVPHIAARSASNVDGADDERVDGADKYSRATASSAVAGVPAHMARKVDLLGYVCACNLYDTAAAAPSCFARVAASGEDHESAIRRRGTGTSYVSPSLPRYRIARAYMGWRDLTPSPNPNP